MCCEIKQKKKHALEETTNSGEVGILNFARSTFGSFVCISAEETAWPGPVEASESRKTVLRGERPRLGTRQDVSIGPIIGTGTCAFVQGGVGQDDWHVAGLGRGHIGRSQSRHARRGKEAKKENFALKLSEFQEQVQGPHWLQSRRRGGGGGDGKEIGEFVQTMPIVAAWKLAWHRMLSKCERKLAARQLRCCELRALEPLLPFSPVQS